MCFCHFKYFGLALIDIYLSLIFLVLVLQLILFNLVHKATLQLNLYNSI